MLVLGLCLLGSLLLTNPVWAIDIETPARHAVIMDGDTGAVLFQKAADVPMPPASMSKLMTTLMVFDQLKHGELSLSDEFYVSKKAWQMQGSKMWTLVDTKIRVEDLLRGIIVQSGNDACVVVAEGLGGSEDRFAELMNAKAKEIGLQDSTFRNSTGWPHPEHRMSALDLARLARHIIKEYPEYYAFYAEREFEWSDIRQPNRNPLLGTFEGADGMKTGHTQESGYGLVGSAKRGDRRLIIVVNGLDSETARATEGRRLLGIGFREFKRYELFLQGEIVGEAKVQGGQRAKVPLIVRNTAAVLMHESDRNAMKVTLSYDGPLTAPVAAGSEIGALRVEAPGIDTQTFPVVTAIGVDQASLLMRAVYGMGQMMFGEAEAEE